MTEPLEVPPNVPPDWRDWIDRFPTMKSLAILCFFSWIVTPLTLTIMGWLIANGYIKGKEEIDGVTGLVDRWLDALNWLTAAAVFGVTAKFATTKPDVIRAEGEVKAKTIVAAAQADAIAKTAEFQVPQAPAKTPMPDAVTALKSAAATKAADPGRPIGESVAGEGD